MEKFRAKTPDNIWATRQRILNKSWVRAPKSIIKPGLNCQRILDNTRAQEKEHQTNPALDFFTQTSSEAFSDSSDELRLHSVALNTRV